MRKKRIRKWVNRVSVAVISAAFFMMTTHCDAKESKRSGSAAKIEEERNYTIPLAKRVKLEMVWIQPGTFIVGNRGNECGRNLYEVNFSKGFWLGKYEVTQAQYMAVMGENPAADSTYGVGENYPVYYVSWEDASDFCDKLTEIEKTAGKLPEGYKYTLPSTMQWEYACHAGTTTDYNNGSNAPAKEQFSDESCPHLEEIAWYYCNSKKSTHPVGQKKPNAWGLYDMHGNVAEWQNNGEIDKYALCGGSWLSGAKDCSSKSRCFSVPGCRDFVKGFRVALVCEDGSTVSPLKEEESAKIIPENDLGYVYYNGQGVEQDYQKAFNWYRKAAEAGDTIAQSNLGYMYYQGQGVEQDYEKAFIWYQKSAEGGNVTAQSNLGYMYYSGQGVERDYEKAVIWFWKAANHGDIDAQCNLGCMYELGQGGVQQDYKTAAEWYKKAAAQGNIDAQKKLDLMRENGLVK